MQLVLTRGSVPDQRHHSIDDQQCMLTPRLKTARSRNPEVKATPSVAGSRSLTGIRQGELAAAVEAAVQRAGAALTLIEQPLPVLLAC